MEDYDRFDIYSVALDPEYCPQCGSEVGSREFDAGPMDWCGDCELVFSRGPIAAVHVVVRDDDHVLLLDELIPQHDGVLSLPGGHAHHDEGPREAVLRELEEETALAATPDALSLVTVYHAETDAVAFHFATYALEYADTTGTLSPEADGFEIRREPVDDVVGGAVPIRDSDRERVAAAFDREHPL
ncbi:NUDIX hydrolase [Halorubellus salinus]|uniref:NUDIX hydrolase n=1 Tax=Halorubellus salinus TaxID=755309 RepID=UPI001D08F8D4|nr:NUDIX domain-containing protein [Halorubellus salinus]